MKRRWVIRILYAILVIVCCVVLYCMGKVCLNIILSENQTETMADDSEAEDDEVAKTCDFDNYVEGSQAFCQKTMDIKGVKTIVYYMDNFDKKPLVILQHGLFSKKEDMSSFATALAEQGYLVVTPDAVGHGEDEMQERLSIIELVRGTSKHYDTIIRYFEPSEYVDVERMGLVGLSLGGLSSFYYAANGSYNPKVVVSLCATPQFADLVGTDIADKYYARGKTVATANEEELAQLEAQIVAGSPYDRLLSDKNTCFFMLCGDADTVVPHEGNEALYEELQNVALNVMLVVKKNQGHEIILEDMMRAVEYLAEYL